MKKQKFDFSFVEKEFEEIFLLWLEYKKQRKESYKTQASIELCYKKLKKLAGGSHEKAREIVESSMASNYAGLFELKNSQNSQKTQGNQTPLNVNDYWKYLEILET